MLKSYIDIYKFNITWRCTCVCVYPVPSIYVCCIGKCCVLNSVYSLFLQLFLFV